jgi:DNA polymerase
MTQQIDLFDTHSIFQTFTTNKQPFYSSLEQLAKDCQSCKRCGLSKNKTHVVIGRGNPHAKLLVIGEAPGAAEDKTGLPFVGKSGQLLKKILTSIDLNLERDTYITNIIRCRPPDNRTPNANEIKACRPYLIDQIRLIKPKILLLVGATALFGLTGEKCNISKIRGKWLTWENIPCMSIFHPAYLLRNPTLEKGSPKWLTWHDLIEVKQKLDRLDR